MKCTMEVLLLSFSFNAHRLIEALIFFFFLNQRNKNVLT